MYKRSVQTCNTDANKSCTKSHHFQSQSTLLLLYKTTTHVAVTCERTQSLQQTLLYNSHNTLLIKYQTASLHSSTAKFNTCRMSELCSRVAAS